MPFSQDKLDALQFAIRRALVSTAVEEQDRAFLRDTQAKFDRFGRSTRLSQRQYRRLMRLAHPDGQTARAKRRARPRQPHRRHGRGSWRYIRSAVVLIFLASFLAYQASERFPEHMGPLVALTAAEVISGKATHVRDGDTIEVAGTPIRFGSLDCAERDTARGRRATARMRELVAGEQLTCHLNGRSSYDRKIGRCLVGDGRDLAAIMINEGYCRRYW